jgi:phospholipid/cholesterol/gamma-HCH transport system substrate-binding protein
MRFRVGLFVLAMLVLLAVLSVFFAGRPGFLKSHQAYTVVFSDAPDVGAGTPVRRSGVHIGEVRSTTLDEETGQVRVVILVERPHTLRRGDQPTLVHGLLGGDTSIDFLPPRVPLPAAERTPVEPGEEVTGVLAPDAQTLLGQTTELVPSTQETLNEIRKSLQRFERMTPQLEDTLKEYRDLARDVRATIPDLRRTNDEVQVTVRTWGRLGERLDVLLQTNQDKLVQALDNFNDVLVRAGRVLSEENQRNLTATLRNVRAGTDNLESISKNTDALIKQSRESLQRLNGSMNRADDVLANLQQATRPMAERSAPTMKNLDESAAKLNQLLGETRELLRVVGGSDGTLGRLTNNPALYNNLNEAACQLVRILPRLDRMMHDMEVFADKIARHPESLGLGGVVTPSSGLKEAPSTGPYWMHGR